VNARALAIRVLERVEKGRAFLNLALDSELTRARRLDPRDAALVTELCYGTTRRQLALDCTLAHFSSKPLSRIEPRVLCALRVGAYQLFYLRVPGRAAVAETVEAVKQLGSGRAAGFANALLRKLSQLDELPLPPASDWLAQLALRESHPQWLVARWVDRFGRQAAEAMVSANNRPAPLTVRANATRNQRSVLLERLARAGLTARPTTASPQGVTIAGPGNVRGLPGYEEGLWQVQDEAAQLVVPYAAVADGSRVLDACAAPGGKACQLAERAFVVANDIHRGKLRKLEAEAERLGLRDRIELLEHDAATPFPERLKQFDAVLVDAPCSGLGTLHRHPELRYRRKEWDIPRLVSLQRAILDSCRQAVSPGGLLIFAVCSTEPEEGEKQVDWLLRAHPEFALEPPPGGLELPLERGFLLTLPGEQSWDGFFAARLRRRSG
jgi:16S rRNA (cytosine967-C5)-methyltransferase